MTSNRNSFIYLLEIYDLLIEEPRTFNFLRSKIGIGYAPLKRLLEKFELDDLVIVSNNNGIKKYEATAKLFELFIGSFYDGINRLRGSKDR